MTPASSRYQPGQHTAYQDAYVYDVQAQAVDGTSRSAVCNARLWLRQAQQHRVA